MLTIEQIKDHLNIDFDDARTNKYLLSLAKVAERYLEGAIGKSFNKQDERAIQLALFYVEDMFDRKSTTVKENSTLTKLKNDFMLQLQVEEIAKNDVVIK